MLYRSAYAERTKVWCLQNNHQVFSGSEGRRLSWETNSHPEKPLPAPMSHEEMYEHYYQTSVRQNFGHPFTEDVFVQQHQMPGQSYGAHSPLVGMSRRESSVEYTLRILEETQVDPFLLNADDDEFGGLPATQYDSELFNTANMEPTTYEDDPADDPELAASRDLP
ncbi:MAG: hypothetical protein Q9191_006079 [Dirinaria sp. TL-2023a]